VPRQRVRQRGNQLRRPGTEADGSG